MYTYEDIFRDKKTILFVTAHPDDVDVFFGGTLCRLSGDKKKTPILILTTGSKGSRDQDVSERELSQIRNNEEIKALDMLGVDAGNLEILEYSDGEVNNSMEIISKIAYKIRKEKPEIVCTFEPHNYYYSYMGTSGYYVHHRDHRNTGICVLDAVYPFSRDKSFFKDQLNDNVKTHSVYEVLFTGDNTVNTKVDITNQVDAKKNALMSHLSQFDKKTVEEIVEDNKEGNKYFEKFNFIKLAW